MNKDAVVQIRIRSEAKLFLGYGVNDRVSRIRIRLSNYEFLIQIRAGGEEFSTN